MDPDQDRQNVGPDLGPNCLQRLSADNKSCHYKERFIKRSFFVVRPKKLVHKFKKPLLDFLNPYSKHANKSKVTCKGTNSSSNCETMKLIV